MRRLGLGIVVGWLVCACLSPAFCAAADKLPEIVDARIGFGGYFKVGHWVPIELTILGGTRPAVGRVSVLLPDGSDLQTFYHSRPERPLSFAPNQPTKTVLLARLGRLIDGFPAEIALADSRKVIPQRADLDRMPSGNSLSLADGHRLHLMLGGAIGLPANADETLPYQLVSLASVAELPTSALAYDGVDTLAITTSDAKRFQLLQGDTARLDALESWIHAGGHLILGVGSAAQELLGPQGVFARFAPGKLVDVETLASGAALEEYSGTTHRIAPSGRGESVDLRVPRFDRVEGIIEVSADGLPLVIRSPRGFGRITFVACDLDTRPLSAWAGRAALVRKLFHEPADKEAQSADAVGNNLYGYSDLTSQLNANLDEFPGVSVVPFWIVAVLILGYVVLIGPGDFFFVKHVLRRMEFTWLTFPAIVVTVSLGAYFAATWLKGSQLRLNQVDIVDVDSASGHVRGGSWIKLFSPNTDDYTLSLQPQGIAAGSTTPSTTFSWLGVPGQAWRGMNTPSAGADLLERRYDTSPQLDAVHDVPIDVWSSRGFQATWQSQHDQLDAGRLRIAAEGSLAGNVTNVAGVALDDCFLAYDRWAYKLDRIEPGATIEIKPGQQRDGLEMLLKKYEQIQSNKFSSVVNQARPFDVEDPRVPPVVRMMMFHQAAGGPAYSTLHHGQATWTDLSAHLRLGRAVLVGEAPRDHQAAQLQRDGQPLNATDSQRWTFYRIVVPVDLGTRASASTSGAKRD
ncbi:MAG: hypothetical protein JNM18_21600 [Planctomycetaceae bacterium]|nr:hypothetical protein [Planctomycetaceae bacterium]